MRKLLKLIDTDEKTFQIAEMKDLSDGDYFKMYEPTGEPVKDERGETLFKVIGEPTDLGNGIYQVNIEQ